MGLESLDDIVGGKKVLVFGLADAGCLKTDGGNEFF